MEPKLVSEVIYGPLMHSLMNSLIYYNLHKMKHCDPYYCASFLVYPSNFSGLVYFSIIPAIENDKLALRYLMIGFRILLKFLVR